MKQRASEARRSRHLAKERIRQTGSEGRAGHRSGSVTALVRHGFVGDVGYR